MSEVVLQTQSTTGNRESPLEDSMAFPRMDLTGFAAGFMDGRRLGVPEWEGF